jgi:hypothetical protein
MSMKTGSVPQGYPVIGGRQGAASGSPYAALGGTQAGTYGDASAQDPSVAISRLGLVMVQEDILP